MDRENRTVSEGKLLKKGDRACECKGCTSCKRDGIKGLCEFILLPDKNMMCSDCIKGGCGSGISFTE